MYPLIADLQTIFTAFGLGWGNILDQREVLAVLFHLYLTGACLFDHLFVRFIHRQILLIISIIPINSPGKI